jgi:ABC-type phosphate transport system substrate-binding protein
MGKMVVLSLEEADSNRDFRVTLEIGEDGQLPSTGEIIGKLPPAQDVFLHYNNWQETYRSLVTEYSRSSVVSDEENPEKIEDLEQKRNDCKKSLEKLKESFNNWLQFEEFRPIESKLLIELSGSEKILLFIKTTDSKLQKLPWEAWELFANFPSIELSISLKKHNIKNYPRQKDRVNILAVWGKTTETTLENDRNRLESLPHADVRFIVEPRRQEFDRLVDVSWDVLFLTAPSSGLEDSETGHIWINRTENLAFKELKNALGKALSNGLQVGVFNCWNSLDLAGELTPLNIPHMIVMREPMPDVFAQDFFEYFLESFSAGKSLYVAVREALEKLHELSDIEMQFPGASLLPVIFQNPTSLPVRWNQFLENGTRSPEPPTVNEEELPSLQAASPTPFPLWKLGIIGLVISVISFSVMAWWLTKPICSFNDLRLKFWLNVPQGKSFTYGGSSNWAIIRDRIDPAIQKAWSNFPGRNVSADGSSDAIQKLIKGQLTFAQLSRPLFKEELDEAKAQGFSLEQQRVAIDAIAVVVNPKLQIPGLTVDQLRGIYTGKITNWQQVGGPNLPITPLSRTRQKTGTVEFFIYDVLRERPFSPTVKFVNSTATGLQAVATTPGGIYYDSALKIVSQCQVRPLPLGQTPGNYIAPYQGNWLSTQLCTKQKNQLNETAFKTGDYPVTRNLFVIIKDLPGKENSEEQAGRAYADLLLTPTGQRMLEDVGFIPILPSSCPAR